MSEKPVPTPSEDTVRFWEVCDEGRFVVQRCAECGRDRFYPAAVCPHCWCTDWDERELEGTGTVDSYTAVHRPPSDAFADDVPYVVALVSLADDVTVMSNVHADPSDVSVGDPVTVVWEERDGRRLYHFRLEES